MEKKKLICAFDLIIHILHLVIHALELLNSCLCFNSLLFFGVRHPLSSFFSCSLTAQTKPQSHPLMKEFATQPKKASENVAFVSEL